MFALCARSMSTYVRVRMRANTPDVVALENATSWTSHSQESYRKPVLGSARRDKGKGRSAGLTEEQKQEIREAFDLFDTDGSGARYRYGVRSRLC